jgi:N-methylhydantoinase A
MSYRIAVDTGGTFTDVVVADADGALHVSKAPTDTERAFTSIEGALAVTAETLGTTVARLLADTSLFVYATTRATNAVLEGATARTAFLTTKGFPDVLLLREGGKSSGFDFVTPFPEPYVPRRLTFEVDERIDAEGEVVVALDEEAARTTLRELGAAGVEAIAVCLLWSIVNPAHEQALARLIEQELPGVPYTLSHRLNPIIREYRRASSAAIDASLKPLMQSYLRELEQDLDAAGFAGELVAATSAGGVLHIEDLVERPIYSARSGPSMAPVAGRVYGDAEGGWKNVIVCDTGGTSFDVSLVREGTIKFTRETWLGEVFTGHMTGLSSVDARSIGAGGGSIAWLDGGGMLRIGPQSAGADPGPACYGHGGSEPTVTDAAAVLGYLDPDFFLGGRMQLDIPAARAAMGTLADQLGKSVEETARAVMTVANEHMVRAIQEITVNEGVDPRESLVVAGGGAAGLNIVPIIRELGCRQLLLPRTAGALSACGAQFSDVVTEETRSRFTSSRSFDFDAVNATLEELDAAVDPFERKLRARGVEQLRRTFSVEARYAYQVWELEVPLENARFESEADVERIVEAFHDAHERVFAVREHGAEVELVLWKLRLTAELTAPSLAAAGDRVPEAGQRTRTAVFEGEPVEVAVHRGTALQPGTVIAGPAIVEEPTTTLVLYPGSTATVSPFNNYLVEVA